MAKAKRSSKAKRTGWAGIPKDYRAAVRLVMSVAQENGKRISPQQAYSKLQTDAAHLAAERAEKEKTAAADQMRLARQEAQEAFSPALGKLADVRDVLGKVADGDSGYFTYQTLATFARAALKEAACEIERAAFTLGLLPKQKAKDEGWFVERFN